MSEAERPSTPVPSSRIPRLSSLIIALLVLVTLALYWPVQHYEFVNYDDPVYVYENPIVLRGLTREGLAWAFGRLAGEHTYWHPLTWLSHMTDCQLFGPKPGPPHVVNVLFHALNAVLVFVVLRKMTGAHWRSAAVAGLFAWHPLQVDTVAWVTERKNVLSTCFWLLTLYAYARYVEVSGVRCQVSGEGGESKVQSPKSKVQSPKPATWYLATLALFTLGLMCKPMLVTVPVMLLLLDFWPLRRVQSSKFKVQSSKFASAEVHASRITHHASPAHPPLLFLLLEKVPFFLLSAGSALITILAHVQLGSLANEGALPLFARLANALVSYTRYLGKTLWPAPLAVHYPHPGTWPLWAVVGASLLLSSISLWTLLNVRRRPYLLAGWLWFLITLLPTIGIIQAASQAMADRFAYVPLIGLFLMLVWLLADLWQDRTAIVGADMSRRISWPKLIGFPPPHVGGDKVVAISRLALGSLLFLVLAACLIVSRLQLRHWRDSETLFRHTASVTKGNYIAEFNLGSALAQKNKLDDARDHFSAAIKIKPDYAEAHDDLGVVLQMQGKPEAAETEFASALHFNPKLARARNNLGLNLQTRGKTAEALIQFQQGLQLEPINPELHNNLAKTLAAQGKPAEAKAELAQALRLKSDYADAHCNLAKLLLLDGNATEAASHYLAAVQSQPEYAEAHYQLGVILSGRRQTDEAIVHFREAVRLRPDWLEALNNLAWLFATQSEPRHRNGPEAMRLAAHAVELTQTNNAGALDTLAAAYAEAGRFTQAVATAQQAIQLAANQKELAAEIEKHRLLYEAGRPWRE
jgi:tetratricopeptide (TPR) repeat protein